MDPRPTLLCLFAVCACGPSTPLVKPPVEPPPTEQPPVASPSGVASADPVVAASNVQVQTVLWPSPDWPMGTPEEAGIDEGQLDAAANVASGNGSYCLLVIRHGKLVYEKYFNGADATTQHKSWSLAKSYSGTLVGIAIDEGKIASLDEPVSTYVTEWAGDDRKNITVRDLVTMTSGLKWSAFQDYVQMATLASNDTQFALGLPLDDAPGSKWVYHNGAVQILEPLFRAATGMTIEAYAQQHLWSKLGMNASWLHDMAGNATPYANVMATCRDHARLGYLYLHHGQWNGQQVVSESWVQQATTPSQAYNRAYGLLFWVNGHTPAIDAMNEEWPGWMVPFAPADLFAARGFGNQFIDVIPSLDLEVVRFGTDPMTNFDLAALVADSKFPKHDAILAPILDGLH